MKKNLRGDRLLIVLEMLLFIAVLLLSMAKQMSLFGAEESRAYTPSSANGHPVEDESEVELPADLTGDAP